MKFTSKDIEELKRILAAAKVLDIEGIVITDGMVGGARISIDGAIISPNKLSIPETLKIGIGRVSELDKRLMIFSGEVNIEGKCNEAGDVSLLTITSGKSKMQFRCTSAALMEYPKSNDDPEQATLKVTKAEVQQIVKSIKTLKAETAVLQVSRDGTARIECVDSANDKFEIELSNQVKYADEETSLVQSYSADLLVSIFDHSVKESEDAEIIVGEIGSLTATINGHTVMIFPLITGEE